MAPIHPSHTLTPYRRTHTTRDVRVFALHKYFLSSFLHPTLSHSLTHSLSRCVFLFHTHIHSASDSDEQELPCTNDRTNEWEEQNEEINTKNKQPKQQKKANNSNLLLKGCYCCNVVSCCFFLCESCIVCAFLARIKYTQANVCTWRYSACAWAANFTIASP